jgi:hypothetical protein
MSAREFKILYNDHETGPAEVLKGRIARIVDHPLLCTDQLWKDDIVLLDRDPRKIDNFARIKKVLWTRYPYRGSYSFSHDFQMDLFLFLLRGIGVDCCVAIQATEKQSGIVHIALEMEFPLTDLFQILGLPLEEEKPIEEVFPIEDAGTVANSDAPQADQSECSPS